jgi:release factor glutamine methyltransferase
MQCVIQIKKVFKNELKGLYEPTEIDRFILFFFEHLWGYSQKDLIVNPDRILTPAEEDEVTGFIERLRHFEPIQYILGKTEFYGLPFKVRKGVLIPRQETEELVQSVIKQMAGKTEIKILDMGCGSGCIPITIKKNLPNAEVWACDISETALKVSAENALFNEVFIHIVPYDILSGDSFPEKDFDIIISNPPYVTEGEKRFMMKNVLDYEPELALFVPDNDPLKYYKAIVKTTADNLKPGGAFVFEINENHGESTALLMMQYGFKTKLIKDINGKDRILIATK